jgi:hypothetical protein
MDYTALSVQSPLCNLQAINEILYGILLLQRLLPLQSLEKKVPQGRIRRVKGVMRSTS